MVEGRAWKWSRKNTFLHSSRTSLRYKERGLGALDPKTSKPGELTSSKESGGFGVDNQRLGPQFVLTAVHTEDATLGPDSASSTGTLQAQ